MSVADDVVNAWVLQKFRERYAGLQGDHLVACPDLHVKPESCTHGVECGCYSEYTRDDGWVLTATVECSHGEERELTLWSSSYNVADAISEIISADYENFECIYDEED